MNATEKCTHLSSLSDNELVSRHLTGDENAFTEIFLRYRKRLLKRVNGSIDDPHAAEDVVQKVFMKVFLYIHGFDLSRPFSVWIFTIARNLTKNELRERSRRRTLSFERIIDETGEGQFADERFSPERLYRNRYLQDRVAASVDKLPQIYREVFLLKQVEGKHLVEIGKQLGVPRKVVKSRLNRGRIKLRKMLIQDR